jgi:hypothetical protein
MPNRWQPMVVRDVEQKRKPDEPKDPQLEAEEARQLAVHAATVREYERDRDADLEYCHPLNRKKVLRGGFIVSRQLITGIWRREQERKMAWRNLRKQLAGSVPVRLKLVRMWRRVVR